MMRRSRGRKLTEVAIKLFIFLIDDLMEVNQTIVDTQMSANPREISRSRHRASGARGRRDVRQAGTGTHDSSTYS